MAAKHYYLFGIRIWSVIIEMETEEETEESEEIETDEYSLAAYVNITDKEPPAFGFTPWTPDYIDWRHAE